MKILQWNIWYKDDIDNILKTILEVKADIVCLQELTVNHPHYNQKIDTAKYIADGIQFDYFYKPAQVRKLEVDKEMSYGNGIFSRYPITKQSFDYILKLDTPSDEEDYSTENRVYIEVELDTPSGKLSIGTTHMSYTDKFLSTPAKEAEADKLVSLIQSKKERFILTGDFNALPESYTVSSVLKHLVNSGPSLETKTWTTKPFSYKGFEADDLHWRLDYCFATPDIKIKSAQVLQTPFSDHLPILIEI